MRNVWDCLTGFFHLISSIARRNENIILIASMQIFPGINMVMGQYCQANQDVLILWKLTWWSSRGFNRIKNSVLKYLIHDLLKKKWFAFLFRYIRVIGTHNTVNRYFHLVTFQCFYQPSIPEFVDGIICKLHHQLIIQLDVTACGDY